MAEAGPVAEIRVVVPRRVLEELEKIEARLGVSKEDIVARAIVKVLEELRRGE